MPRFDYSDLATVANELIAEFGQNASLIKTGGAAEGTDPWDPKASTTSTAVILVELKHSIIRRGRTMVKEGERLFLVSVAGLEPKIDDRIDFNLGSHYVMDSQPLNPGGTDLLYEIVAKWVENTSISADTRFDYGSLVTVANELIDEFGQDATLQRPSDAAGGADPWNPKADAPTSSAIVLVETGHSIAHRARTLIKTGDRSFMVSVEGLAPTIEDKILLDGDIHFLLDSRPLDPGGTSVVYNVLTRFAKGVATEDRTTPDALTRTTPNGLTRTVQAA